MNFSFTSNWLIIFFQFELVKLVGLVELVELVDLLKLVELVVFKERKPKLFLCPYNIYISTYKK